MSQMDFHENFVREQLVARSSDRSFGLAMAGALSLWSALNGWYGGWLWPWLMLGAAGFLTASLVHPEVLKPLNRLWFNFGLLLHNIVNPILMALVFYCAVMPTGLVMRMRGKDLLRLRLDRDSPTYWIKREPGSCAPETMRDQF